MPIESYDRNGRIRNYLADRLKAQRAIKSQTYNEETIKNAETGLRNMIRAGAKNAPWYSPDKPKGKFTFASIKQAINKVLRRDDKNK